MNITLKRCLSTVCRKSFAKTVHKEQEAEEGKKKNGFNLLSPARFINWKNSRKRLLRKIRIFLFLIFIQGNFSLQRQFVILCKYYSKYLFVYGFLIIISYSNYFFHFKFH